MQRASLELALNRFLRGKEHPANIKKGGLKNGNLGCCRVYPPTGAMVFPVYSLLPFPFSLFPFFYRQLRQMKYLSTGSPVCLAQYSREARGAM
jgi:hypothetical protein